MKAPLFLLHGYAGQPGSWRTISSLLPHRTCLAPALFGHDPAIEVTAPIPFEEQVSRIVDALPPAPVRLVGYSLGGRVALGVLARARGRIASAVIIGANPGLASIEERASRVAADAGWARMLRERGLDAFIEAWEAQPLFASQARSPAPARAEQRALREEHRAASLAHAMTALGLGAMPDYTPLLPRMDLPIDLVVGALDAKFALVAASMMTSLPRATLHTIEDAGHNVVLEQPEALARVLDADG